MTQDMDKNLSTFVNTLGIVVFVSIAFYHVLTASRKDLST
ncbi:unnamed protein product [Sphacelaria rigidula]